MTSLSFYRRDRRTSLGRVRVVRAQLQLLTIKQPENPQPKLFRTTCIICRPCLAFPECECHKTRVWDHPDKAESAAVFLEAEAIERCGQLLLMTRAVK